MELISGRVMVFGTYDVFHPGHEYFITEAMKRSDGGKDSFVVVVARDKTVQELKPVLKNPELLRLLRVQEAFPEATVVLGDEVDPMAVIREYRPGLVCLGYDQVGFSQQLQEQFPEVQVERIEAFQPEKYKSSLM